MNHLCGEGLKCCQMFGYNPNGKNYEVHTHQCLGPDIRQRVRKVIVLTIVDWLFATEMMQWDPVVGPVNGLMAVHSLMVYM